MAVVRIKGKEFELDLLDADVMEKYEALNAEVLEKVGDGSRYKNLSTADAMREQIRLIDEFIDGLFGAGTAKDCFGGSNHLGDRMDAFGQISEASNSMQKDVNRITERYGVGRLQNREQRRNQQFNARNKSQNRGQ